MLFKNIKKLDLQEVSHNPKIKKRVILNSEGLVNIIQLAQSYFPPGERATAHSHIGMAEVFMVKSGTGLIRINYKDFKLSQNTVTIVESGEIHEIENTGDTDLVLNYFAIKTNTVIGD